MNISFYLFFTQPRPRFEHACSDFSLPFQKANCRDTNRLFACSHDSPRRGRESVCGRKRIPCNLGVSTVATPSPRFAVAFFCLNGHCQPQTANSACSPRFCSIVSNCLCSPFFDECSKNQCTTHPPPSNRRRAGETAWMDGTVGDIEGVR